jgi:hypothetical protein
MQTLRGGPRFGPPDLRRHEAPDKAKADWVCTSHHLGQSDDDSIPACPSRWREGMKAFKELPSRVEIRVRRLDRVNWFVRTNREDVGHRYTFLLGGPADTLRLAATTSPSAPITWSYSHRRRHWDYGCPRSHWSRCCVTWNQPAWSPPG